MSSPGSSSTLQAMPGIPAKTALAMLLALIAAFVAVHRVTEGFRVLTTEDARRLLISENPKPVPNVLVQFESGMPVPLLQDLHADGRVAIVAFIYTRCNAVCSVIGTEFQQMQESLRARRLGDRIRLISVSFDPRDMQEDLAATASRMRARADSWHFSRVEGNAQLTRLLDAFGITVVPAPLGEFQHNAAFHVVTPDGMLVRIVDFDQPETALSEALAAANAPQHTSDIRSGAHS